MMMPRRKFSDAMGLRPKPRAFQRHGRVLQMAGPITLQGMTFTDEAINLILRISEGTLRAVKNLCVGSLIEAVRDQTKTVDLKQVNAVLMQPHWRHNVQDEPTQPLVLTNQKPNPNNQGQRTLRSK